jgi:hypothetical protein
MLSKDNGSCQQKYQQSSEISQLFHTQAGLNGREFEMPHSQNIADFRGQFDQTPHC